MLFLLEYHWRTKSILKSNSAVKKFHFANFCVLFSYLCQVEGTGEPCPIFFFLSQIFGTSKNFFSKSNTKNCHLSNQFWSRNFVSKSNHLFDIAVSNQKISYETPCKTYILCSWIINHLFLHCLFSRSNCSIQTSAT